MTFFSSKNVLGVLCLRSHSACNLWGRATRLLTVCAYVCLPLGILICVIACWIYLPWEFNSFLIFLEYLLSFIIFIFMPCPKLWQKQIFQKAQRNALYWWCQLFVIVLLIYNNQKMEWNFFLWLFYFFVFFIFLFCFPSPHWIFDLRNSHLK